MSEPVTPPVALSTSPRTPRAPSRRGLILLWTITILASTTMVASVLPRTLHVQHDCAVQLDTASSLADAASELARLRTASPTQAGPTEAEPKLATGISAALAAAGLPASVLASLSPESESVEPVTQTAALVRRRATMVLTSVSLPQLGRFLAAWRDRSPEWTPSRIDLEPISGGGSSRRDASTPAVQPGADLPLRITLAIESIRAESRQAKTTSSPRTLLHP